MNKRGETKNLVVKIVLGIFIAVAFFIVIYSAIQIFSSGSDPVAAAEKSVDVVSGFTMKIVYPLFNKILGFKNNDFDFLKFLAFILLTIVVVSAVSAINMFNTEGEGGDWINFFIGLIVGIIGVRYMPDNIWSSLTAPSSALIATILIGLPFLAMFFITIKMKYPIIRKFVWVFYIIFTIYLMAVNNAAPGINWVYVTFAVAAVAMMFLDASIRRLLHKEFLGVKTATEIKGDFVVTRLGELTNEYKRELEAGRELHGKPKELNTKRLNQLEKDIKNLGGELP